LGFAKLDVFALEDSQWLYGLALPGNNLIGKFAAQNGQFWWSFNTKAHAAATKFDNRDGNIGANLNAFTGFTR